MRELAFNATFLREMRVFASLQQQTQSAWFHRGRLERRIANAKFHIIEPHDDMGLLKPETKLAASQWGFDMLRELVRAQAQAWVVCQYASVGERPPVDLAELF